MEVFEKYSDYYDPIYKNKDYKKEIAFIKKVLSRHHATGKKVLSLGCGTGTYEIILAKQGYKIVGVDRSSEMLKLGRRKIKEDELEDKINVVHGDVTKLKLKGKFDIAMELFNVVGYHNSNSELSGMLKGVSKHLKKGGLFVFDCWHAPAVLSERPGKRTKVIKDGGVTITRKTTSRLLATKDLIEINFDITAKESGKRPAHVKEQHLMRYFTVPELSYFLESVGMKLEKVYNFMSIGSVVKDDNWDIFVVARKS